MGRSAAGVTGMDLKDGSHLVDATTSLEGDKILVLTTLGYGKISYAEETEVPQEDGTTRHYDGYRRTSRGAKGVLTLKTNVKNGELTGMRCIHGDEDLMVITNKGIVIRTPLSQIHIAGRNTVGVKIINLDKGNKVASCAIVPHVDEAELEEELPAEESAEEVVPENNPTPDQVE